jgi:hypothetical protein
LFLHRQNWTILLRSGFFFNTSKTLLPFLFSRCPVQNY